MLIRFTLFYIFHPINFRFDRQLHSFYRYHRDTNLISYFMIITFVTFVDIDECASGPCLNGGTCVDEIDSYTCNCQPGYNGTNCENGKYVLV